MAPVRRENEVVRGEAVGDAVLVTIGGALRGAFFWATQALGWGSGGRTGLAGGAATVAGQVICDLGGLNRIEEIDPFARVAIVQAG